jgi:hypothetical protein
MKQKTKRLISRRVLETELWFAIQQINKLNFGDAKTMIERILERIKEYDLDRPKNNGK